ncbi:MAG TPA: DNRLRE domain-containing protein [Rudaea sp.]|nr:DNRLRE domain-containing protein [Rudaea sp.]
MKVLHTLTIILVGAVLMFTHVALAHNESTLTAVAVAPSLYSISPTSYTADNNNHTMTLSGSNFVSGDTLTFVPPEGGTIPSTASKLTFVSSSQLSYQFNSQTDPGTWSVKVNSADGSLHSGSVSFTVTAAAVAPSLYSISPTSYTADNNNHTMTLSGSNFVSGDTLTFVPPEGGTIPSTASKLTFVSSSQLSYQFNSQTDPGTWSVKVNSADGSLHSGSVSFTVTATSSVPLTPTGLTPGTLASPGPVLASPTVTLQWAASAGATYYAVAALDLGTEAFVVDTTTAIPGYNAALENNHQYRWNVAACNSAGCSAYATHMYFQTPTSGSSLPATPSSLSPGSASSPGAVLPSSTVNLQWGSVPGATYYVLGVRDMATELIVVDAEPTANSYQAALAGNTPYRWNVAACNNAGCSSYASHIYFQTPVTAAPAPPTPQSPSPGTSSSPGPTLASANVQLGWNQSAGATYYAVTIIDIGNNAAPTSTTTITNAANLALETNRSYRWSVAACNAAGCSQPTSELYLQTPAPAAPPAPTPIGPGNSAPPGPSTSGTVTISWKPVSSAAAYSVGLRDLSAGGVLEPIPLQTTASYTTTLVAGHEYKWDVASCIQYTQDTDQNCPNRSGNMYFMQGENQNWADTAPVDPTSPGSSTCNCDKLVMIVHGWNDNGAGWSTDLTNRIAQDLQGLLGYTGDLSNYCKTFPDPHTARECTIGNWHIVSGDWHNDAATLLPFSATANAGLIGEAWGKGLDTKYTFIHLIAHSAGANLIEHYAEAYAQKRVGSLPRATIQETFLDAFCPNISACYYGQGADFAEQYVDSRLVGFSSAFGGLRLLAEDVGTPLWILPPDNRRTNVKLPYAYNFDVTQLDSFTTAAYYLNFPSQDVADGSVYHSWPVREYEYSALVPLPPTKFFGLSIGVLHLGAQLASWLNPDVVHGSPTLAAHVAKLRLNYPPGGRCTLNLDSASGICLASKVPVSKQSNSTFTMAYSSQACSGSSLSGGTIVANTCSAATTSTDQHTSAPSATPQPGMLLVSLDLKDGADTVSFDYFFENPSAVGILQVFIDNALIFTSDQNVAGGGLSHSGIVPIPHFDAGPHEMRVVSKTLNGVDAAVSVSNITFAHVIESSIFANGFEGSAVPTDVVLQPGPEGKDTFYGTVYNTSGTGDSQNMSIGGWADWYYDYIQFNLAGAPASTSVDKAELWLYGSAANDPGLQLCNVLAPWDEATLSLASHPASTCLNSLPAVPSTNGWVVADITDMYKGWQDGTIPNYGIELVPSNNNHTNGSFASSDSTDATIRPKLVIQIH